MDNVYFCGFTSESSFGAWSYLIVRPPEQGGNVLVDSPRFTAPLVKRIEQMGGVRLMFLSHRDDIADHAQFRRAFRLSARDACRATAPARLGIEHVITGEDEFASIDDLLVIPTPGHTRGHQVLLYRDEVLFTGDHLAWSPERETLTGLPRRLLVFLDRADALDGKAAGVSLCVGVAGARTDRARFSWGDARTSAALRRSG